MHFRLVLDYSAKRDVWIFFRSIPLYCGTLICVFCNVIEFIYPSIEQRWLVQNVKIEINHFQTFEEVNKRATLHSARRLSYRVNIQFEMFHCLRKWFDCLLVKCKISRVDFGEANSKINTNIFDLKVMKIKHKQLTSLW